MPTLRDPVPVPRRILLLDPDDDRGEAIAHRARLGGHAIDRVGDVDAARERLLAEAWDVLGIEVLAGPLPASFALRELQLAMRRAGRPMPATMIYVRGALAPQRPLIERMLDDVVPGVERIVTDDPDLVVRSLLQLAANRQPAAVPVTPDPVGSAGAAMPAADEVPAGDAMRRRRIEP